MSRTRLAGGWVLGALATLALVGLSQVRYTAAVGPDGELRLAWRYRSETVEQCRRLTDDELAALPQHMRRDEICERRLQPWRLEVTLDGTSVADDTVRAKGAREDRPLYVFRQLPLPPGTHALRAVFTPIGESGRAPLELDASVTIETREVVLVTYDPDLDRLVLKRGP
ncbi:MAG: hypothetical protein OEO20_15590 [Gemmatimonadota bacterium]|nr:hypothetical protein [Gemmatimonadota bacterium]MDH3479719.1 hypothetical protein [Gemmatimonadota bacterium]MDH3569087.1 hypothetical protein [Gemmatimonadota bacterium]MDH5551619.1 hypothetical protein [Gemmatimonadota bacterium]